MGKILKRIFIVIICIAIVCLGAWICMLLHTNKIFSTLIWELDSSSRLNFWTTYISTIISSCVSIVGVVFTIKYYKDKDFEERKNIQRQALIQIQQEYRLKYLYELLDILVEFHEKLYFDTIPFLVILGSVSLRDDNQFMDTVNDVINLGKEDPEMEITCLYKNIFDMSNTIKAMWFYKVSLSENKLIKLQMVVDKLDLIIMTYRRIEAIVVEKHNNNPYDVEAATKCLQGTKNINSIQDIQKQLDEFTKLVKEAVEEVRNVIKESNFY